MDTLVFSQDSKQRPVFLSVEKLSTQIPIWRRVRRFIKGSVIIDPIAQVPLETAEQMLAVKMLSRSNSLTYLVSRFKTRYWQMSLLVPHI
jgi:hypothetical protein